MTQYIRIISNPARAIDKTSTATTFRVVENDEAESVLRYEDTNASRSHIGVISEKVKGQKVGIIGLGGTGSYILDSVAKTLVGEIHLFDEDMYLQHNAFRSPGAPSIAELNDVKKKVHHFKKLYANMHRGIIAHDVYIDEHNLSLLQELDFVFICIDKSVPKKFIFESLMAKNIPFIDVGMGVERVDDSITGMLRITAWTPSYRDSIEKHGRVSFADAEAEADVYHDNVQIGELNALNACFAVIKWKKLFGIYHDFEDEHNTTYSINVNAIQNEDTKT